MMKRFKFAGLFVLFLFFLHAPALAQSEKMMLLPPGGGPPANLFGQNHWYTVIFRGNGEAVVNARIAFTNNENTAVKTLEFRVPNVMPSDVTAFQIIQDQPDIYSWYGPSQYQLATAIFKGDSITVSLPQNILPQESGSVILYYRAFGYAKKDLVGGRHFTFETLQVAQPINELRVGVSTDSDLVLRGAKAEVNYRFEDSQMAIKGMVEASAPMANTRMDTYIQQIGFGSIVKTASNLQAFESYSVRGSYADSQIKLYAKEIGIGIVVFILFAAVCYMLVRRIFQTKQTAKPSLHVLAVFGLSFISAVITVGYSAVVMYILQNISQLFGYQAQAPVMLLILVISLGVYGLLLGAPALFIGIKRGVWYGIATAGVTIVWLILALLLYLILNISGQNPGIYPMRIMKTLDSSVSYPSVQSERVGAAPSPQ